MNNMSFRFSQIKKFDAYSRPLEELRVKTLSGAVITLLSSILMLTLFVSELQNFLSTEINQELFVDTSRGQRMRIYIDIVYPAFPCEYLTIDTMDISGENQVDVDHDLYKLRLDMNGEPIGEKKKHELGGSAHSNSTTSSGTPSSVADDTVIASSEEQEASLRQKRHSENYCGSCYGAETDTRKCCNSCAEVREAYRQRGWALGDMDNIEQCIDEGVKKRLQSVANEGCRLHGFIQVNKVAGNFHFAPGKSFTQSHVHVHDMQTFQGMKFNCSHSIEHLRFGEEFPGQANPLDKHNVTLETANQMYTYYVKIIPTLWQPIGQPLIHSYQYSVTKYRKPVVSGQSGLPGVFFMYEISPMLVKLTQARRSLGHFLTNLCAIIGGVFTVAGLLDSAIFHTSRIVKQRIGKHS